ncbi:hypothetical protein DRO58_02540 [Candidatus Bathyarchaeota archaeon]|nr:MAG: hypothetical protein DRO58_02540 [Candidatus Bathyarchaeota archaeon]
MTENLKMKVTVIQLVEAEFMTRLLKCVYPHLKRSEKLETLRKLEGIMHDIKTTIAWLRSQYEILDNLHRTLAFQLLEEAENV